jgi:hypothetical protein
MAYLLSFVVSGLFKEVVIGVRFKLSLKQNSSITVLMEIKIKLAL